MENYFLSDMPKLKKAVRKMSRKVLEQLFLAGKTPQNTTVNQLSEFRALESLDKCMEKCNEIFEEYKENPCLDIDYNHLTLFEITLGKMQTIISDLKISRHRINIYRTSQDAHK